MNRRMIVPLVFGIVGIATFLWLGTWQLQRMAWKADILAEIDRRLAAEAVGVPTVVDPIADKYLQVEVSGVLVGEELHVLTFGDGGPGFRIIMTMELDNGRRILVDRGYLPEASKDASRIGGAVTAVGALIWPQETDEYVPEANLDKNIWFARDVPLMADTLNTEEVMVAIKQSTNNEGITPQLPSVNISNRHLEYVLTWYSFAIIWFGMTGYLLWRIKHKTA